MAGEELVGQDIGSPPQNPVPYQRDPFEGAEVQEGTGQAYTKSNLGFGTKPYQFDPFEETTIGAAPKYYTEETFRETGEYEQYFQEPDEDPTGPPPTTQEVSDATTSRIANELGVEDYSSPLTEGTDAHLEQVAQEQGASRDRLVNVAEEIAAGNAPDSPLNRGQAAAGARYAGLAEQYATDELAAREDRGFFGDLANTGREYLDHDLSLDCTHPQRRRCSRSS